MQTFLSGKQRLRQTRELLRIDSELFLRMRACFWGISVRTGKAADYGAAAQLFAQEAGVDEAVAWSAQAKTARWRGVQGISRVARRGFEGSSLTPTKLELGSSRSQLQALAGDVNWHARCCGAQIKLRPGCQLTFAQAAQSGRSRCNVKPCSCSRWRSHAKNPDAALRAGAMAEVGWATGDPKNSSELGTDQGRLRDRLPDEGFSGRSCRTDLSCIELAQELRISTVTAYLQRIDNMLAQPRFAKSNGATELRQEIREFNSASPVRHLEDT